MTYIQTENTQINSISDFIAISTINKEFRYNISFLSCTRKPHGNNATEGGRNMNTEVIKH